MHGPGGQQMLPLSLGSPPRAPSLAAPLDRCPAPSSSPLSSLPSSYASSGARSSSGGSAITNC
jgi:hypothetical protein